LFAQRWLCRWSRSWSAACLRWCAACAVCLVKPIERNWYGPYQKPKPWSLRLPGRNSAGTCSQYGSQCDIAM